MKHIWWGTIVMTLGLIAAWVALVIAGHPVEARHVLNAFWVPLPIGGILLLIGFFGGALDDR